uniref:Zinc knuckle CX2CX4HX4C n=1 Tax=Haemonchus contortus TaxID=6289 RepID=A0A7I4Y422_HAECO
MSEFHSALAELEQDERLSPIVKAVRKLDDKIESLLNIVTSANRRFDGIEAALQLLMDRTAPRSQCVFCATAENTDAHTSARCPKFPDPVSKAIRASQAECKFTEKIARANEMIYVLEARLTESRNKLQKLAQKLGINPKRSEIAQRNGAKEDETKNQSTEDPEIEGDPAWLPEDMSDKLDNVQFDAEDAICRTLKPSQLKMPRFYGDEEDFPEYWAVFRTLVHDNKVLSTVEKMLPLHLLAARAIFVGTFAAFMAVSKARYTEMADDEGINEQPDEVPMEPDDTPEINEQPQQQPQEAPQVQQLQQGEPRLNNDHEEIPLIHRKIQRILGRTDDSAQ